MRKRPRNPFLCAVENCINRKTRLGYCNTHYARLLRGKPLDEPINYRNNSFLCIIEGCNKKRSSKKYCDGHHKRFKKGKPLEEPFQIHKRGVITGLSDGGYIKVRIDGISKAEHVWMAINALGKDLPKGVEVHHINGIRWDNRPENLVICPDRAYHKLIDQRTKAFETCGHADWIKCYTCKQYDDPLNFIFRKNKGRTHKFCVKIASVPRGIDHIGNLAAVALSFGS